MPPDGRQRCLQFKIFTANTAVSFSDIGIPRFTSVDPIALRASPAVSELVAPAARAVARLQSKHAVQRAFLRSLGGGGLPATDRRSGTANVPRALPSHKGLPARQLYVCGRAEVDTGLSSACNE